MMFGRSARSDGEGFESYAESRLDMLRRTAYLLCGDVHTADDLTQTALTKLFMAWPRLVRRGELDGYARQVLLRAYLDLRRKGTHREVAVDDVATTSAPPASLTAPAPHPVEDRLLLMAALDTLTPPQRAAVVLRYWEDLDVNTVGSLLGMPANTVKSHAARGLQALRSHLGERGYPELEVAI